MLRKENGSTFTDKHFKNNIEIGGWGNSEKSTFLHKNIQFNVFAKLFCPALSEILKTETKIAAIGL